MNKILFLTEGKKISGPNTWKNGLIEELTTQKQYVEELDVSNLRSIYKIRTMFKYNIIHAYHISGLSVLFLLFASFLRKKVIFTLHGDFYTEVSSKKGLKRIFWIPFHKYSMQIANVVTYPSNYLLQLILGKIPEIKNKSVVINNGIKPLEKHNKSILKKSNKIILLEVTGFNIWDKAIGIIPLIEAVNILKKEYELQLLILGSGKYWESFKKRYENTSVRFMGQKSNPNKYYHTCDIFVHSTFVESLGYVILEAIVHHKPVISVKIGGIPEILPNYALANPNKISLYRKIRHAIDNDSFRNKVIEASHKDIDKFYWKNVVKDFQKLYA